MVEESEKEVGQKLLALYCHDNILVSHPMIYMLDVSGTSRTGTNSTF